MTEREQFDPTDDQIAEAALHAAAREVFGRGGTRTGDDEDGTAAAIPVAPAPPRGRKAVGT